MKMTDDQRDEETLERLRQERRERKEKKAKGKRPIDPMAQEDRIHDDFDIRRGDEIQVLGIWCYNPRTKKYYLRPEDPSASMENYVEIRRLDTKQFGEEKTIILEDD